MRFGKTSASLAIWSGLAVSGIQILIFLILAAKSFKPDFDAQAVLLAIFMALFAFGPFIGFFFLRRNAEIGYFAAVVVGGLALLLIGLFIPYSISMFVLPGAVGILLSASMVLLAGEDPLPLWRRAGVVMVGLIWTVFFAAQLYGIALMLDVGLTGFNPH